ncbi:Global transcription regulator sge1 [Coemansia guatemalensis]|uniref:Global transcription regulator sge1 n=1 Tax=Coemansia guatemalensis TaxID=2761395 RepID=A0A9W8LTT4_9FUNG|nr:Global transcription regulator sge1 [Coemansia guatemalensis]
MNDNSKVLHDHASLHGDGEVEPEKIDTRSVIQSIDMSPEEVIIGGAGSCFTVTGLKVSTTRDALTIFEACRQNILPRVVRRLNECEKQQIKAGTIVVFDEKEAKMKRWTDGRLWTPSRIMNNFLVYRELDRKVPPNHEGLAEITKWVNSPRTAAGAFPAGAHSSNKGLFFTKPHGLLKSTISLAVPDNEEEFLGQSELRLPRTHQQHLISYFLPETTVQLPGPEDMEELQGLRLPIPILRIQRFRRPLKLDMLENGSYHIYDTDEEEEIEVTAVGESQLRTSRAPADLAGSVASTSAASAATGVVANTSAFDFQQDMMPGSSLPSTMLFDGSATNAYYDLGINHEQPSLPPLPQHNSFMGSNPIHYQLGPPPAFGAPMVFPPSPLELQPPENVGMQPYRNDHHDNGDVSLFAPGALSTRPSNDLGEDMQPIAAAAALAEQQQQQQHYIAHPSLHLFGYADTQLAQLGTTQCQPAELQNPLDMQPSTNVEKPNSDERVSEV